MQWFGGNAQYTRCYGRVILLLREQANASFIIWTALKQKRTPFPHGGLIEACAYCLRWLSTSAPWSAAATALVLRASRCFHAYSVAVFYLGQRDNPPGKVTDWQL